MGTYTQTEEDLIVLDSMDLSTQFKYHATDGWKRSPDFQQIESKLIKSVGMDVYNKIRKDFCDQTYRAHVLSELQKRNIFCVTAVSDDYPSDLRCMKKIPGVLYCRGDRSLLKKDKLAIIGSRTVLPYAKAQCEKIVSELDGRFVICTGLSEGSEEIATRVALDHGPVIGVLVSGHDVNYPASMASLRKSVEEKGLVISEYAPHVGAMRYNFAQRNALLAALTVGVFLVSAGIKSGSLNTVEYAMDYGREVFALPYNIGVESGEGCNAVIKKGGHLTESMLDIADLFGLQLKKKEKVPLADDEKIVFDLLSRVGEAYINDLCAELPAYQPHEVFAILAMLEVKKRVIRLPGNRYAVI